jgi:hypothetical protein
MFEFSELTQKLFLFLAEENGFVCEVRNETRVNYANKTTIIRLGFGEREHSVGMTFGQNSSIQNYYPFEFYLKSFFLDEAVKLSEWPIRSKLEMEIALRELAALLKRCGQPIIYGDSEMFKQLAIKASEALHG